MHDRIFEPRVTSKLDTMVMDQWGVHGRGMALFSIRSTRPPPAVATSDLHKGTSVRIVTDASELSERADQSTWPTVERDEAGVSRVARGPHNIVRRVVEFAVENPGIDVYTRLARRDRRDAGRRRATSHSTHPSCSSPTSSGSASGSAPRARPTPPTWWTSRTNSACPSPSAPRTASSTVRCGRWPRCSNRCRERTGRTREAPSSADIYKDRRGLKIHHTDLADFRRDLQKAFEVISERYYLHLKCEPRIAVGRDEIRVRFDVEKDD